MSSFATGAGVNLVWEVALSPWYEHESLSRIASPIVSSVTAARLDGAAVALLYVVVAKVWREPAWPPRPTIAQVASLMALGGAGAVLMERLALSSGWWSYAPSMPIVPLAEVSAAPVLQFVLLPAVVLLVLPRLRRRRIRRRDMSAF